MKKCLWLFLLLAAILILSACSNISTQGTGNESQNDKETAKPIETLTGSEFTLTAKEATLKLNSDTLMPVWTFNGSVPGPQIRVTQGQDVKINLKNELPEPATIHWHGLPVPNNMDGIPGVTMNAVQPGDTFTYEFNADVPGTYWYHSHQNGVVQLDKGLYGSFIVEAASENKPDRDYTLVLDEWMSDAEEGNEGNSMGGMDHGNMNMNNNSGGMSMGDDMDAYNLFTINGKSGDLVEPLKVKEGERVRIRFINAGFMSHNIHLHGHDFTVTSTDGQIINDPTLLKDQVIAIAPGERYDIEFTANNPGEWYLECHGDMEGSAGMKAKIIYEGTDIKSDQANETVELPVFDLAAYGTKAVGEFTLEQNYDVEYTMDLNTGMGKEGMIYTINGKTFPNTEGIDVKEGDLVKVKITNNSPMDDHPMHLHGHFFQVLSKNGKAVEGSPIIKDTLNLKPGEEYIIAFQADNPGNWLFHCHDLHHASAGMVTEVMYEGFEPDFTPDPKAGNKPE